MRYYSSCLSCGFKSNIKRDSSHRFFQTAPPKTAVCLPVRGIFSDELNQSQLKKKKKEKALESKSHPLTLLCNFSSCRGRTRNHTQVQTAAHSHPHMLSCGPWRSLSLWVALCHGRINYLSRQRLSVEFISEAKTKEVLRSRGITLKLFIVCFRLPSPLCLSPTLFCQLTTRATVSFHLVLDFWYWM